MVKDVRCGTRMGAVESMRGNMETSLDTWLNSPPVKGSDVCQVLGLEHRDPRSTDSCFPHDSIAQYSGSPRQTKTHRTTAPLPGYWSFRPFSKPFSGHRSLSSTSSRYGATMSSTSSTAVYRHSARRDPARVRELEQVPRRQFRS